MKHITGIKYQTNELAVVIKQLLIGQYVIPLFQRDLVWNKDQTELLGDSILRGISISSILTMPVNGNLQMKHKYFLNLDKHVKCREPEYLLDGLQRSSAFLKIFTNINPKIGYYYDMLGILNESFPENIILENHSIYDACHLKTYPLEESHLCIELKTEKGFDHAPETRCNKRFISCSSVLGDSVVSHVNAFVNENFPYAPQEERDQYVNHLTKLLSNVPHFKIPFVSIDRDTELNTVVEMFERVNTTGKKLDLMDLINAKSFTGNGVNRRKGISRYIAEGLEKSTKDEIVKAGFLRHFGKKSGGIPDQLIRFIRIINLVDLYHGNKSLVNTKQDMLNKEPGYWFAKTKEYLPLLVKITKWMESERLIELGTHAWITYAMALFIANPKMIDSKEFKEYIKKYTFYLIIRNNSKFAMRDYEMTRILYKIGCEPGNEKLKEEFSRLMSEVNLRPEDIITEVASTSKSSVYHAIINNRRMYDISGQKINNVTKSDMHHLYPKSFYETLPSVDQRIFKSAAAIVPLEPRTNRGEINKSLPEVYVPNLLKAAGSDTYFVDNLLDAEKLCIPFDLPTAKDTIKEVAVKMSCIINEYFANI